MAPRKTERILNLTICLLVSGRYLPKSRIREAVEGYHNLSDAAFERTFERDKDELRSLGVPIEVGSFDPLLMTSPATGSSPRSLHCRPSTWTLRRLPWWGCGTSLAAREHGRVDQKRHRQAASGRRGAGCLAACFPGAIRSGIGAGLRSAVERRPRPRRVSFTYRDGDQRTLEPWGLTSFKGRWYVIGRDVDRAATRMFKLSRMTDLPKRVSRAGSYEVPADLDLRRLARSLAPRSRDTAVLAIRAGKAPGLARRGEPATSQVKLPPGFAVYAVGFSDLHSAAEEITQYAADVVVLEPAELREQVVRGLTAVAESVTAA